MKFHYPDCSGVAKMAEHNKYEFYGVYVSHEGCIEKIFGDEKPWIKM